MSLVTYPEQLPAAADLTQHLHTPVPGCKFDHLKKIIFEKIADETRPHSWQCSRSYILNNNLYHKNKDERANKSNTNRFLGASVSGSRRKVFFFLKKNDGMRSSGLICILTNSFSGVDILFSKSLRFAFQSG